LPVAKPVKPLLQSKTVLLGLLSGAIRSGKMSDDPPVQTRPFSDEDTFLQQKYRESVVSQADLMDKLATQLITLELAIPGLYATVLKLVQGDKATLPANNPWLLYLTFGSWLLALILTLIALTPRKWKVNKNVMIQDPRHYESDGLGVEDFFFQSARYKKQLLIPASLLLWAGIFLAALLVFS
jgi:hypothetical protein